MLDGIDATNKITKLRISKGKNVIYLEESEIKGPAMPVFVFLEVPV